ncbi:hypothetical protein SRO_1287 [Streptomyces rochei]|nr:hypothetical protein SRO_1287 [Streptomyces rochei]
MASHRTEGSGVVNGECGGRTRGGGAGGTAHGSTGGAGQGRRIPRGPVAAAAVVLAAVVLAAPAARGLRSGPARGRW